jgi:Galactose oxidase, central domain
MVYYPTDNDVILFGGWGTAGGGFYDYLQDTWAFSNGHWTELISNTSCTPTTCPSPRAGAMLAYDAQDQALVLFGGYIEVLVGYFAYATIAYNNTWIFANDTWTNVTSSAGAAPEARFLGAMTYDSSDNYVLLFGGQNASQDSLQDSWKFVDNAWTELTFTVTTEPTARGEASIADSPSGYVMLFGGLDSTDYGIESSIVQNSCNGAEGPYVGWWFYKGAWTPMDGTWFDGSFGSCVPELPAGSDSTSPPPATTGAPFPPCGRVNAALGWSPKNNRFVVYGGYGPTDYGQDACMTSPADLNDTFSYALPPGGYYQWNNASYPAGPPAREQMGYASDFGDGYFEIFGGFNSTTGDLLNATWRFYEIVYAKLTGPLSVETAPGSFTLVPPTWTIDGYGGTGDLSYRLTYTELRNTNPIHGTTGCSNLTSGATDTVPYNGTWSFTCYPTVASFNVDRVKLTVIDEGNTDKPTATANWTVTIVPPQSIGVYSEFEDYFYQGISFENTFSVFTEVAYSGAKSVTASIGGSPIAALNRTDGGRFWNVTLDTASYGPGTILHAEAQWGNWTLNTTYTLQVITPPSWLLTLFQATGASQSITTQGSGPWNKTFTIDEKYSWNLDDITDFSIPVPLVGGDYGLIPAVNVVFAASSTGSLTLTGTFSLSTPDITIGPASLQVTADLSMSGTFDVVGSGVQWESASAQITVSATLSASIPIYGFSLFGINIGFTLQLSINPSITLDLILAPATLPSNDLIPGVAVMIQKFLGSFSLALQASINFGIGIASVGLGVGLSVAVVFTIDPFNVAGGWVNGTIFVTAQFLWWSDSFNIAGPATIFGWGSGADPARRGLGTYIENDYNNGTDSKWVVQEEYYAASDYDTDVWTPAATSGPAVSDIYPWTEVTGAAAYNGADLFYTDDNTSQPQSAGLLISAAHLDSSTNAFSHVAGPFDSSDYEIASPQATTLANGDLFVVWTALPSSEADVSGPLALTSMELQGAVLYPNNDSWGPVRTFSTGGFAESYQLDALGSSAALLELLAEQPLLSNTGTEHLVEYNLTTGAVIANESTSDWSEIVSFRAASGLAVLDSLGGNFSLVDVTTLSPVALSVTPPTGSNLISATFAEDSSSTLVLLYRAPLSSVLYLYDAATGATIASVTLGVDYLQAQGLVAGATTYVFARTVDSIQGWTETAGTVAAGANVSLPGLVGYGLVPAGNSILLYSIVDTGGNSTEPIRALELAEFAAPLPSVPSPVPLSSPASSSSPSSTNYLLYLAIAAVGVVLILAVVAVLTRRRPPASTAAPPMGPVGGSVGPSPARPQGVEPPPPPPSAPPTG